MTKLKQILQSITSRFSERPNFNKIAIGVSGGCDSVALLFLMQHLCKMLHKHICIFHINHSIREESKNELSWMKYLAKKNDIEFYAKTLTSPTKEELKGVGVESWARKQRYIAFTEMNDKANADVIATAHTANDQAETVLMRLMRGTSMEGISGIRSSRVMKFENQSNLYWRPLIFIVRAELEEYLTLSKQNWIEDNSNTNLDFFRNRLRREVIPFLEQTMPGTTKHIVEFANEASEHQKWFAAHINNKLIACNQANILCITNQLHSFEAKELLRQWLVQEGFGEKITRKLIESIHSLLSKENGKKIIIDKKQIVKTIDGLKIITSEIS